MFKLVAGSIKEYKKYLIFAPICILLETVLEVLIPYIMSILIDEGVKKNNMDLVWKLGLVLVGTAILALVLGVSSGVFSARASAGFGKNLRKDLYYAVQKYSFSNIDKYSTSSIITRMTTDVSNIQNALQMLIRTVMRSPCMLIFSLIMAFTLHDTLPIIFVVVLPILAIGLLAIIWYVHPIFERVFKKYDNLNTVVQENLHGIRVVKSYVREEREIEKFNKVSNDVYKDFSRGEKIIALNSPLMQFCVFTCILAISWFGAKIIIRTGDTDFTTGKLMSLIAYVNQILMSLMLMSTVLVTVIVSRASVKRIHELIDEKPHITDPENPVYEVKDGSITFENVSFSYAGDEKKLCLIDVNLDIKSGETVGIIGGTGSSKTTLVQLIPRLYDATEGVIKVGGVNVKDYHIESLRNEVSVVLQKNTLFSGTIKDNLRWGNENATEEEMIEACKIAQADPFIQGFEKKYDTYIEQGGTNLSGGQKQRLCIARALLKKPKILILDDSTSAVDTKTDAQIRNAFKNLMPNTTKIIIAQRIASVQEADKIIVLDGGKVNAVGTHEELLKTNKIYAEVYESQTRGGGNEK